MADRERAKIKLNDSEEIANLLTAVKSARQRHQAILDAIGPKRDLVEITVSITNVGNWPVTDQVLRATLCQWVSEQADTKLALLNEQLIAHDIEIDLTP